jgi:hypothetical protein
MAGGSGLDRPAWWDWEFVMTSHTESRMEERGFSEVELRAMLEDAISIERGSRPADGWSGHGTRTAPGP